MSDSFLAAFDKLADLGEAPTSGDVAAAMASVPPDVETVTGSDSVPPATDTVQGSEQPAGDTIDGGADTIQGGDDTVQSAAETVTGADTVPAAARGTAGQDDALLDSLRRIAAAAQQPPAEQPPAAPQQPEQPPLITKDEQEFLAAYEKDWPDVARAEALRRRVEYTHLVQHVYGEVAAFLKPHLEMLDALATRTHLSELSTREPEYDTVRDQVIEWVGQQPKYLQPAYQYVIEHGTADEVSDLFSRWREATKQPTATSVAQAPKPKDTALPPAAKQAAAAMAPVVSKRSAPSAGVDPGDFNSAFDVASAAADKL